MLITSRELKKGAKSSRHSIQNIEDFEISLSAHDIEESANDLKIATSNAMLVG